MQPSSSLFDELKKRGIGLCDRFSFDIEEEKEKGEREFGLMFISLAISQISK